MFSENLPFHYCQVYYVVGGPQFKSLFASMGFGVTSVPASAMRCVGNVGTSITSLPVNYPKFGPRQRRCVGNVVACCLSRVRADATSVRRQRRCLLTIQSSGRGNVGASVTSLPDNYRESLEQLRTGERRVEVGRGDS